MCAVWVNYLLPNDLKSCQKCKKSPNLVTLPASKMRICMSALLEKATNNC